MKTSTPPQALYLSFFSKDFYRSVVSEWKGIAFLYLLALVVVSWLLVSLKVYFAVSEAISGPVSTVVGQLPSIGIKDGELTIDKASPYELTIKPTEGDPLVIAVFDTKMDDSKGEVKGHENVPFLITKHFLYIQGKSAQQTQQYELKQFGDMEMNQDSFRPWLNFFKTAIPICLFGFCTPASFIFSALQAVIYAAIGLAISGAMYIKLSYGELIRLAVVAMTPTMVIETAVKLFLQGQAYMFWTFVVGLALSLGYLVFAILANKGERELEAKPAEWKPDEPSVDNPNPN